MTEIVKVPLDKIDPNPYQPETRIQLTPEVQEFYGRSILRHGLLQTPVVRPAPYGKKGEKYQMGDGWGRLQGYKWLLEHGHPEYGELPVEVRDLTDDAMALAVFEANGVRKDLNPIETAQYFTRYLEEFHVTEAQLAAKHNITQGEVANTIRLLQLPKETQYLVAKGNLPQTHARTLLRLTNLPEMQKQFTQQAVKDGVTVNRLNESIDQGLWNKSCSLSTAEGYNRPNFDVAGCVGCKSRLAVTYPYGKQKKEGRCLDKECWGKKQEAAELEINRKQLEATKKKGGDKILTSKTIQSGSYERLDREYTYGEFDRSACRTCDKVALFKYNLTDTDKPQRICLDPACMRAKKAAHTRDKHKVEKQEDRVLTDKLALQFQHAHDHPKGALVVLARHALAGHLNQDAGRDLLLFFPDLPKNAANGQLDIEALRASLPGRTLDNLTDLAVAASITTGRRSMSGTWRPKLSPDEQYCMAHLEGTFDDFCAKLTTWQESNCRGCNLVHAQLIGSGTECCGQTYNKELTPDGTCKYGKAHLQKEAAAQAVKDAQDRKAEDAPEPAATVTTTPPLATMPPATQAAVTELATATAKKLQRNAKPEGKETKKEKTGKRAASDNSSLKSPASPAARVPTSQTETKTTELAALAQPALAPPACVETSEAAELESGGKAAKKKSRRGASRLSQHVAPPEPSGDGGAPPYAANTEQPAR